MEGKCALAFVKLNRLCDRITRSDRVGSKTHRGRRGGKQRLLGKCAQKVNTHIGVIRHAISQNSIG